MTRCLVGNARSDGGLGDLRAWRTYFIGTECQINDATDQQGDEETKLRMKKRRWEGGRGGQKIRLGCQDKGQVCRHDEHQ